MATAKDRMDTAEAKIEEHRAQASKIGAVYKELQHDSCSVNPRRRYGRGEKT